MNFNTFKFQKYYTFIAIFIALVGLTAFLDVGLTIGLIFLGFLFGIAFLILSKLGIKSKTLYLLLLIALIIHLGATLFIHYADFQPFSGGSGGYKNVHLIATELSKNFSQGNFSFEGVPFYEDGKYPYRYYSLIIGIIYTLTMPEMIVGQMFGVWLAVISILLTYLIVLKIGGSKKWAFLIGLIVSFYPSHLFYGSLLLKDALVTPLALAGLFFTLKLIRNFSWRKFLIFYVILISLISFRFYIGYALLFTFILSWPLLSELNLRKKIAYTIIIIPLLGFCPELSINQGFYGINTIRGFLSQETISFYQEKAYSPPVQISLETPETPNSSDSSISTPSTPTSSIGFDSSWEREKVSFKQDPFKFSANYLKSFTYVLLGPLPWQMKESRHFLALFETIPWFFLFFFISKGIWNSIKIRNKYILPLIIFSLIVLMIMVVFINNFGIITRIRIPAFIALLCLIPFAFKKYE